MMWALLALAGVTVAFHIAAYRTWRRVAERLGLHFGEGSYWGDWEIYGELRGCKVSVRNIGTLLSRQRRFTRIAVSPPRRISTELELRGETLLSQATKVLTGQDLQLGDRTFDQRVLVGGREDVVYAVLDAPTRGITQRFLETWGGQVAGGEVLRDSATVMHRADPLERLILDAVRLAEALQTPEGGYHTALIHNLAHDPLPTVRRKCLELLLKQGGATADEAIRIASADADPELMLAAADAAGTRALGLLRQLAVAPQVPASVAERALLRLSELDTATAAEVARVLINGPQRSTTGRALELAGHLGLTDLLPRLTAYTRHPDGALAAAAAHSLAALGGGEEAFITQLGHAHPDARLAAAEALASVGTLVAIKPLNAAAQSGALPRKEARRAIEGIQARHAHGTAGGLAMVDDNAGGLAVVEEGGQLSVSEVAEAEAAAEAAAAEEVADAEAGIMRVRVQRTPFGAGEGAVVRGVDVERS